MSQPALLFDLDGTLIESDPLHARVYIDLFAERGRSIDTAFYLEHVHGRHNTAVFREHMPDEDPDALDVLKEARFREMLADRVEPVAGARALIAESDAQGWRRAVVTNAPRENAHAMLAALGLSDAFDTLVIGAECGAGKPDPAPYRTALNLLGAGPRDAIAFEDSVTGIASATGAGIRTIGVRSSQPDGTLRGAGAALTISDFNDTALGPEIERLEGAVS